MCTSSNDDASNRHHYEKVRKDQKEQRRGPWAEQYRHPKPRWFSALLPRLRA